MYSYNKNNQKIIKDRNKNLAFEYVLHKVYFRVQGDRLSRRRIIAEDTISVSC